MEKKWTFKTKAGCQRLLCIFLAAILIFGFFGHLIATNGGDVKITRVTYDVRGASVDADLYYPVQTCSADKYPAVIVAHGGGVLKGVTSGLAEEFARRGFVVLNFSAFGAGLSEQPPIDDYGYDAEHFSIASTCGLLDAIEYVRNLEYVDATKIGIVGHSMGAWRAELAAEIENGFYSLNDIMLNILCDEFGLVLTEEEICMDATELANTKLNADQLAHFMEDYETEKTYYDTRLKTMYLMGCDGGVSLPCKTVSVGGHDVQRGVQTNFGILMGYWDHNIPAYEGRDTSTEFWHEGEIQPDQWYVMDAVNMDADMPGTLFGTSVVDNAVLQDGIDARSARIVSFIPETHSKNFYSAQAANYAVKYIEQTLDYNGGELGAAGSTPLDSAKIVYTWSELLNLGAMLSMIGLVAAVVGLLAKAKFFASSIPTEKRVDIPVNKKKYWIFSVITVALTFFAMYKTNSLDPPSLPTFKFLPQFSSWWLTVLFLAILAVCSAVFLVIYSVSDKKAVGQNRLAVLNFKIGVKNVLKSLLAAVITLAAAYMALALLEYLFNEDYRWWMASFGEMRAEYWRWVWRFALLMLPSFLVIGASTNYSVRTDIPEWKDTLITVIVNSAGVWLLALVNILILRGGGEMFSSFISAYGFLAIVPITVYITRKLYLITNSIWYGAFVNSLLLAWSIVSSVGLHCNFYYGQNAIMTFLGM